MHCFSSPNITKLEAIGSRVTHLQVFPRLPTSHWAQRRQNTVTDMTSIFLKRRDKAGTET